MPIACRAIQKRLGSPGTARLDRFALEQRRALPPATSSLPEDLSPSHVVTEETFVGMDQIDMLQHPILIVMGPFRLH